MLSDWVQHFFGQYTQVGEQNISGTGESNKKMIFMGWMDHPNGHYNGTFTKRMAQ